MTINNFINEYIKTNDTIELGTTALRNYIKKNKDDLESNELIKTKKKLSSLSIDIIDPVGLFKKIA